MKILINVFAALTYLAMIGVNILSNSLPINGVNAGQVSDSLPNLFAPAGLTFSIWGIIYLLLGAYTLYQFGLFQKDKGKARAELFGKVGILFIITSIANIFWIFSWHYGYFGLSVILMLVLLVSLIRIADLLNKEKLSNKEKAFIRVPFSVYFGWITVATIANTTAFLVSISWNGFGMADEIWMTIILLVGAGIGVARTLKDKNIAYGLVLVWAYFGIWFKHTSPSGFDGQYPGVITTVIVCILLFVTTLGFVAYNNFKKPLINKPV